MHAAEQQEGYEHNWLPASFYMCAYHLSWPIGGKHKQQRHKHDDDDDDDDERHMSLQLVLTS
jgi:hypothetical protein